MARNAEKAMTTLARWRAAQEGGSQQQKTRRPYLASECEDLREAEKWRNQVISEIARKVSQIQNACPYTRRITLEVSTPSDKVSETLHICVSTNFQHPVTKCCKTASEIHPSDSYLHTLSCLWMQDHSTHSSYDVHHFSE